MPPPDARFSHLRDLAAGQPGSFDEATLPPEAFEAWRKDGIAFGKFVRLGEVGRGGTSVVYRAWQADLRREVALKVVTGLNPELRERFLQEARVGAGLSHPAVLTVYETGEGEGALWFSMPLVRGRTLDACGLDSKEAALAVAAAARGVQAAHDAGVIHRDLKPGNIMRDDAGAVLVMDFGLALTGDDATRISVTGQVLGTPHYMAPEQAEGRATDARTDVYGLGATLYRLVAGRAPYSSASLPEFLRAIATRDPEPPSRFAPVPADLQTVVLKAIDRDPARRYPSPAALADDLERFARGESVLGRRAPLAVRAWRWAKRRPGRIAALAVIAVLAVAASNDGPAPAAPARNPPQPWPQPPPRDSSRDVLQGPAVDHPLLKEAEEHRIAGRFSTAIEILERLQQEQPDSVRAWAACGDCRTSLHDWKSAETDFARAIALQPGTASFYRDRGQARMYLGSLDGAEADYNEAIRLDPKMGLAGRARVHALNLKWDEALVDADAAVGLEPENLWVRTARAVLLYQMDRFADSVADYDVALRLAGPRTYLLRARGRARLKARDFRGALEDIEKAIGMDEGLREECAEELEEIRQGLAGE